MDNIAVGSRLRQIRMDAGRTQAEFASDLGLAYQTYRSYESGNSEVSASALVALHRKGVNVVWVLTGEGAKSVLDVVELVERSSIALDAALDALDVDLEPDRRAKAHGRLVGSEFATGRQEDARAVVRLVA
ncbi:MAG: helix-turn-helix transcriptional regulator [Gammaproteobacteria bacterium]|nr:helix-turn-helix transcriptional regulator [Gammaproteobacteria bacterium]